MLIRLSLVCFLSLGVAAQRNGCKDLDNNCPNWVTQDRHLCTTTQYIRENCLRSCSTCVKVKPEYDEMKVAEVLRPIAFLLGKWRNEGGKARFPTIPVFTYGEELDFHVAETPHSAVPSFNYSSFAWGHNEQFDLHSEYGFLTVDQRRPNIIALTTVMNNGFTTVEEGELLGNTLTFRLKDIGRISFSRDLPVHGLVREFTLLDSKTMEQRTEMETLTHTMQEHTFIRYKKIYP